MINQNSIWPTLRADNASELIDFLVNAFGFDVIVQYGDDATVDHAELSWPQGGAIMLGSYKQGPGPTDWALRPGTAGVYLFEPDPFGLFDRATDAGATVLQEPHTTEYGSTECSLIDPEGNRWSFGTYRGAADL